MLEIKNDIEYIQLVRALQQRVDYLDSVDPLKWTDEKGTLKECRAASALMLNNIKEWKKQEMDKKKKGK